LPKPGKISAKTRFLLFWAVSGVLELPLLALMAGYPMLFVPVWLGVTAHVLSAALLFFAPPKGKGYLQPTRHWGEPLGIVCFMLPGLGCFLAGYSVLSEWESVADKHAYIFDDDAPDEANPLAGMGSQAAIQKGVADAMDVLPAVDALLSRDRGLKRGAIEALSRIQTPEAVSWIRKARGDEDPEVRFYATAALTRLKHDFESAIQAAEKEVLQNPGDLGRQVSLQRVRYEYAMVGILENEARGALLDECRSRLDVLSSRLTDALHLLFLVEKTAHPLRALELLDRLETALPKKSALWTQSRAELLFELGRLSELRAHVKKHRAGIDAVDDPDPRVREWHAALLWWSDA